MYGQRQFKDNNFTNEKRRGNQLQKVSKYTFGITKKSTI